MADTRDSKKLMSEETYEKMHKTLYDYYLSRIGLLDLLNKFEEILFAKSPQTEHYKSKLATAL